MGAVVQTRANSWKYLLIAVIARETVLGVGAIELDHPTEPTLVVVDERETDGLDELLTGALVAHATALAGARAA